MTPEAESYVLADVVLLVDELFHFHPQLLVGPFQLLPLVLGLLRTETQTINTNPSIGVKFVVLRFMSI